MPRPGWSTTASRSSCGVPRSQAGPSLYAPEPDYANPGSRRTSYSDARQPVRNGDVANLALDLLGLGAVPGSEHDRAQDLDWN